MSQDLHDRSSTPTASTIGGDLIIAGDVTSTGNLVVDGRVQGDVRCLSLVLGETSQIEGNVNALEVVICGRLIGSVRGQRVMLQATAHVEGDLFHNDLAMEQGVYFEGGSRRRAFGCSNKSRRHGVSTSTATGAHQRHNESTVGDLRQKPGGTS